ncbi:unnamed protein product [Rhizophagus irregularis]|nr:unnamed protein product [Rhizophagus irregularis]
MFLFLFFFVDFVFPGSLFRLSGFFINFSFLDYLGYWILSSQVFYKFCLPGFFISDSWIIWDIGFRLPGLFGILVCGVGLL